MAFNKILASIQMRDSYGDIYTKEIETDTLVLATAQAEIAAFLLVLEPITDLGVVSVKYSYRDTAGAFDPVANSSRDVGATFQGVNQVGQNVSLKIPGIKSTFVGAQRTIDVTNVSIDAALDYWLTGTGSFTLSDGDTVESWTKGTLDR